MHPRTRHFRLIGRIADWDGHPVHRQALRPHEELHPGWFELVCIEDPSCVVWVRATSEADLSRKVAHMQWQTWPPSTLEGGAHV